MATLSKVPPLPIGVPLVDPKTGAATSAFAIWWEQLFGNQGAINDDVATKASKAIQIISGGGLTGGGDLSANRTLAVGAGTGITVNADDVAIDTTAEAERIRDVIGAALVAGSNITITVNDAGDTITIAASGGGGARTLITETVTSGSQASVTFSSIPATYRDLEVRVRGRGTTAAALVAVSLRFNGDSAANYDNEDAQANGTTNAAFANLAVTSATIGNLAAASATASVADFLKAEIADYRGTTFQKAGHWSGSIKTGTSAASKLFSERGTFWWRSTAAITQVDVLVASGGFVDGSVVSLYGLS